MESKAARVWRLLIVVALITASVVMGCQVTTREKKVARPVISPGAGMYDGPLTVTITCATAGAEIRYTLNDTDPTESSLLYTGPITVELGTIIKAKAFKEGYEDSEITTEHYRAHYPVIIGSCYIGGDAHKVVVSGDYAYVIGDYKGVTIVNVANKRNPFVVARHGLDKKPEYIAISGNTVFVTYRFLLNVEGWRTNLVAIDVTNPNAPQTLDAVGVKTECATFTVGDGYAYLIGEYLKVVDISNLSELVEVGSYSANSFGAQAITVNNNIAYAAMDAWDFRGVRSYDVSNPRNPYWLGSSIIYDATDIVTKGKYVYVSTGRNGLCIVDALDPTRMRIMCRYGTSRYLTQWSDLIFTINADWDLSIIDITRPEEPTTVFDLITPGQSKDVCVDNNYIYVADAELGLQIFDFNLGPESSAPAAKDNPVARSMTK